MLFRRYLNKLGLSVYVLLMILKGYNCVNTVGCNEIECGPRVSKCMLLKACNCSITRANILNNSCSCCNECIQCLDKQYTQCCSCFGLCNPGKEAPHMNSYVDKFDQDEEDLIVFDKVATVNKLGTTYTFPVLQEHNDIKGVEMKEFRESKSGTFCTVVYLDKCISHEQCSRQCLILGASMLRWFHTGCCECIGHTCLPYGSNIARCKYCTEFDEDTHSQLAFRQSEL